MSALSKLTVSVDALAGLAERADAPQKELLEACAELDASIVPQLSHMVARAKEVDPDRRTYGPKTSASILALAEKLAAVEPIIRDRASAAARESERAAAAEAERARATAAALEEQRQAAAVAAAAERQRADAARAAHEAAAAEQLRRANERLKAEQDARKRAKAKANQPDIPAHVPVPAAKPAAAAAASSAPPAAAPAPAPVPAAIAVATPVKPAAAPAAAAAPPATAPALPRGQVIHAASEADFERVRTAARASEQLLVIDFSATWCGPCRGFAPVYEAMAKASPDVVFMHVDCDRVPAVGDRFRVHAFPTFHLYWRGELLSQFSGASAPQLQTAIDAGNVKIDDVLTQEAVAASMQQDEVPADDAAAEAAELAAALKMSTDAPTVPAAAAVPASAEAVDDLDDEMAAAMRLSMQDATAAAAPVVTAGVATDDDDDDDLAAALRLSMAPEKPK